MPIAKRSRRTALLVAVNLVVICAMVELGTRFAYPVVRPDAFTWQELRTELLHPDLAESVITMDATQTPADAPVPVLHPFLGYVYQPGSSVPLRSGDPLSYSDFGFYGDSPSIGRNDDEVVVAISGGSVAASLWHHEAEYIRKRFAAAPEFDGKRVRVQSFALGGYKQPQMLQLLSYALSLGIQIDVWIELDGFNDAVLPIYENLVTELPLDFPRDWRLLADPAPSPAMARLREGLRNEKRSRERTRERFAVRPLSHVAAWLAFWDILDRRSLARIARTASAINDEARAMRTDITDEEREAAVERSIEIWRNASIQMRRLCAANNIRFIHFIQPNQYVPDSKPFNEEERKIALQKGGYRPAAELAYPRLIAAAKRLSDDGYPVVDLTGIFRDETRTIYRDSCCHLNSLGNDLMAVAILKEVLPE